LVVIILTFTTKSNFLIKTDKLGYIDAINLLSSLLASIVATVYSITIVALQLASTQFSPRILRYFLSHNIYNQITLGIFLGWVVFCLLLKFWLIDAIPAEQNEVPSSMKPILNVAIYGCIFLIGGLLPHFIITIAESINAASITRKIALHTISEVHSASKNWIFQEEIHERPKHPNKVPVLSKNFGYLRSLDIENLIKISQKYPEIDFIEQVNDVGSYISQNTPLAYVAFKEKSKNQEKIIQKVRRQFEIGKFRSYHQDIHFGVRQMVDIALKAISPAVNDPTTAINCIDYLGEIVREILQANMPSVGFTKWKTANVYLNEASFDRIINQAFDQIYHYGRNDFAVTARLINTISQVINFTQKQAHLDVITEEILEIGEDFYQQYRYENISRIYTQEQLTRVFRILQRTIRNLQKQYEEVFAQKHYAHIQELQELYVKCERAVSDIQNE
ncbi:MAG: DUF2254 domain-containing protein, partial [Raineya sp.]|nr:DUF2254 domain-containing protein [Raineya sp.]